MLKGFKYKYLYFGLTICLTLFLYAAPLFAGDATLSWEPPTTNTDGTPLTDLAGHVIYYGTSSGNYSQSINVGNVTTYQITNLTDGFTYYFIVTAYNTSGNESESSEEVSKTIPLPDITPPTVTITLPTSGSTFATNSNNFNIGGTASANVGVTQVAWSNSSGGSGTASGTTSWSVNGIALQSGTNVITITAGDAAGNTDTDTLTVTYNPPVSTPTLYPDDFNDGNDNGWTWKSGKWAVKGGEYSGTSASIDAPAFSVIDTETQDMTIDVDASDQGTGTYQNFFIVFAYDESNRKAYWAGARVGGNMWSIEEMDIDTGTWTYLASIPETINTGTWYSLRVIVSGDTVTLYADGLMKVSYTFPGGMPVGKVGLGGQGNHAHYDDFLVDSGTSPPSSYSDDFNDGNDNGWTWKSGKWAVKGGEYSETSVSIDAPAFSVIDTETQDMTIDVDASDQGTGAYQNFFIVFAYDESNRKAYWAGARVGGNMWSIEEMDIDTGTWSYLASIPETINTSTWYSLRVIVSRGTVTLYVDGLMKVSYTFAGGMPVGKVGLGGQGNHAHYDNFSVNY